MLGGQDEKGGAVDRIDPGREDLDAPAPVPSRREGDQAPEALPDPVFLHEEDVLGPFGQEGVSGQQLLGVVRDLEEPLLHLLLGDLGLAAPTAFGHDLLVGQDGPALGAPVDPALLADSQPLLEHFQENPLVPLVVVGEAGVDLPRPVVGDPQPLELGLHVGDIVQGPGPGMDAALDGGVLGRHAQRVPADRVEDVEALHDLEPGDDVADRVVPDVAHVDVAGGVGVHLEAVELRLGGVFGHAEGPAFAPGLLPLGFDGLEIVRFRSLGTIHGSLQPVAGKFNHLS